MNDKHIITNVSCDEAEAQRKANDYARRVFGDSVEFEVKVRS